MENDVWCMHRPVKITCCSRKVSQFLEQYIGAESPPTTLVVWRWAAPCTAVNARDPGAEHCTPAPVRRASAFRTLSPLLAARTESITVTMGTCGAGNAHCIRCQRLGRCRRAASRGTACVCARVRSASEQQRVWWCRADTCAPRCACAYRLAAVVCCSPPLRVSPLADTARRIHLATHCPPPQPHQLLLSISPACWTHHSRCSS